jgi:hypothetical protein
LAELDFAEAVRGTGLRHAPGARYGGISPGVNVTTRPDPRDAHGGHRKPQSDAVRANATRPMQPEGGTRMAWIS